MCTKHFFADPIIFAKMADHFHFRPFFRFFHQNLQFFVNKSWTGYCLILISVLKVAAIYLATGIDKKYFFQKSIMAPQAAKDWLLKSKNLNFWTLELHNFALPHQMMLKLHMKVVTVSRRTTQAIFCRFQLKSYRNSSKNDTQYFHNFKISAILRLPFPWE